MKHATFSLCLRAHALRAAKAACVWIDRHFPLAFMASVALALPLGLGLFHIAESTLSLLNLRGWLADDVAFLEAVATGVAALLCASTSLGMGMFAVGIFRLGDRAMEEMTTQALESTQAELRRAREFDEISAISRRRTLCVGPTQRI